MRIHVANTLRQGLALSAFHYDYEQGSSSLNTVYVISYHAFYSHAMYMYNYIITCTVHVEVHVHMRTDHGVSIPGEVNSIHICRKGWECGEGGGGE